MFILVCFGYKLFKYYSIDCLTASLADAIWIGCIKETLKVLGMKDDIFTKEISQYSKRLVVAEKKFEIILAKEKQQEDLQKSMEDPNKKVDPKAKAPPKVAPPAKKGAKGGPEVQLTKAEQERLNTETELEKCKAMGEKYTEKQLKLRDLRGKWTAYLDVTDVKIDIVDKLGERKYMNTKLDQIANTFLSDKGVYYQGKLFKDEAGEDDVELLNVEGFVLRTAEEDETAVEETGPTLKKDDKKKKGKK